MSCNVHCYCEVTPGAVTGGSSSASPSNRKSVLVCVWESGVSGGFTSPSAFSGRCEVEDLVMLINTRNKRIYRLSWHPALRVWQTWKWRRLGWALSSWSQVMFSRSCSSPSGVSFQFTSPLDSDRCYVYVFAWHSGKREDWHTNNIHSVMLGLEYI